MLTKALFSLSQDRQRVSFVTCLFILLSCFAVQVHYIGGDVAKYSQLRAESPLEQVAAQLKAEKKEFLILDFKIVEFSPTLLVIPILFIAFFLGFKTRRGYFKSCLSPPIGDN